MIESLQIKNFKSIRDLVMPCRKLNILLGEPNSGKSNILEALALKSQSAFDNYLNPNIFRYKSVSDLFYDFNIGNPIEVLTDGAQSSFAYSILPDQSFENLFTFSLDHKVSSQSNTPIKVSHEGKVVQPGSQGKTNVRYYEFRRLVKFVSSYLPHLSVPNGENLPGLLLAHTELKKLVSEFFQSKGLNLTLKPVENEIAVSKFVDGEIYSYPYSTISETLQRVVFYMMAIKSNQNAVLLFDEPEANTFPPYTKYIAERIALDETNQFFISTHNPYLLMSLIEKSTSDQVSVGITVMKNYQTEINILNENQIARLLDLNADVFFNFPQILGQ